MNEMDWAIGAVLLVSTALGLFRGVIREILAIVGWALAIFAALRFAPELGRYIPLDVADVFRTAIAGVVISVLTVVSVALLGKVLQRMLVAASITFEDRAIGGVFGFVRGVVIVCLAVFLLGMTTFPRSGYWRNSIFVVPAERVIDFVMPMLPEDIVKMRKEFRV